MGHKLRLAAIILGLLLCTSGLCYAAFYQLAMHGLEAEAKLMISYAHTLERGYKLENHHYEFWDRLYGATQRGEDHCEQPEAAADIGFLVPGCHRESAAIPRFAYRIVHEQVGDRYRIEAVAGSDKAGRSLICFQKDGEQSWQSSQNFEFIPVVSCW